MLKSVNLLNAAFTNADISGNKRDFRYEHRLFLRQARAERRPIARCQHDIVAGAMMALR